MSKARGALAIAKEVALPRDAATQTMAMIGRKGAGKTYLSQMIAEQMLDHKDQVIVLDPVGVWWGLRVGADGRSKGKQIFVIGGQNGDVPLVPEAGARIAQLIVEKGISAVIDVSEFRIGERKRFCQDFGEEFFQLKKAKRSPVCLFLEEAQLVVPQNIRPEEGRMYSAFEQIVRLGRNYGIGSALITQRPQSVNKEVLSQVECLFVLQVTGPHERKALEYWVQEAGADRQLIGQLPGLARGEGYVWSPSWLKRFERVHFSKKQTFDASATPEMGHRMRTASLSAIDVKELKADMVDVVEQAEKDDPVALRRKIAELEKTLANAKPKTEVKEKRVEIPVFREKDIERLEKVARDIGQIVSMARIVAGSHPSERLSARDMNKGIRALVAQAKPVVVNIATVDKIAKSAVEATGRRWGFGELKILGAVAQHQNGITREHLTVLTGYKRASRNTYLQRLSAAGLVEQKGERFHATESGVSELGPSYEPMPESGPELVARVMSSLPQGEAKILSALIESRDYLSRDALTEETGYERSTRNTYIQRLGARELIEIDRDLVRAAPILL